MKKENTLTFRYFGKNLTTIVGIVLIWRGIWYILDTFDRFVMNGHHFWTALIGIVLGFLILYLPDKDLKELEKL